MSKLDNKAEKAQPDQEPAAEGLADLPDHIYLVPYPKVVFLYPTLLVTLVAALWMTWLSGSGGAASGQASVVIAAIVLATLATNLFVLTVDFPRATSLTLFFVVVAIALGISLVTILKPDLIPIFRDLIARIRPSANATFYWLLVAILGFVFVVVKLKIQFDYWEVRRNELLHHHGVLSDLRRYPTSGLQIEKEINDVFEYLLMRSGRLILRPQGENRAFVLDNVPGIDAKEEKITRMLSAMQVKVHSGD